MLIKKRLIELEKVIDLHPGFSCQGMIGDFISKYIICEVLARKIQSYYLRDNKKREVDKIQTQQLSAALRTFELTFDQESLKVLFRGGEGKRGTKSARQLRNGYLHSLSTNDKTEIEEKYQSYMLLMDQWIQTVANRSI